RYAEKLVAPASLLVALCAALGADAAFSSRRRAALLAVQAAALAALGLLARAVLALREPAFIKWLIEHGREHLPGAPPFFIHTLHEGLTQMSLLALGLSLCGAVCAARPLLLRAGPLLAAAACLLAPF